MTFHFPGVLSGLVDRRLLLRHLRAAHHRRESGEPAGGHVEHPRRVVAVRGLSRVVSVDTPADKQYDVLGNCVWTLLNVC